MAPCIVRALLVGRFGRCSSLLSSCIEDALLDFIRKLPSLMLSLRYVVALVFRETLGREPTASKDGTLGPLGVA